LALHHVQAYCVQLPGIICCNSGDKTHRFSPKRLIHKDCTLLVLLLHFVCEFCTISMQKIGAKATALRNGRNQDDDVRAALAEIGVQGITVTEVKGFGRQKGHTELYRGAEYTVEFVPKLQLEIATRADMVEQIIETLLQSARTGQIGDGKIFIREVASVVRIRTGEKDHDAI